MQQKAKKFAEKRLTKSAKLQNYKNRVDVATRFSPTQGPAKDTPDAPG